MPTKLWSSEFNMVYLVILNQMFEDRDRWDYSNGMFKVGIPCLFCSSDIPMHLKIDAKKGLVVEYACQECGGVQGEGEISGGWGDYALSAGHYTRAFFRGKAIAQHPSI